MNQIILIRTAEHDWAKATTFEEAARDARVGLNTKFTVTIFEGENLSSSDIKVSDFDGSAEYPKEVSCVTLKCLDIIQAFHITPDDLLSELKTWSETLPQECQETKAISNAVENLGEVLEESYDQAYDPIHR